MWNTKRHDPRPGIWDGRSGYWWEDGLFQQTYMRYHLSSNMPFFETCYYCALEYKEWYLRAKQETLDAQAKILAALP